MLSAGDITPEILHAFEKACKGYFQNKDVAKDKQDGLAVLDFKDFMSRLRGAFLPTGWEDNLKSDILSMRQGDQGFWEWYNSMT
ncbi:hypothetical protein FIBSPDRAFT_967668, partial [Athelia psychrophila]